MQQNTNTALLIMDMQPAMVSAVPDYEQVIRNTANAIARARAKKIPVIYVTVGFRQGAPEVSMNNKSFGAGKERFSKMNMEEFMKIHPDLAPQTDEVTVIKRRVSAFTGSDLEVILRAYGTQHLILSGFSTSGVVLSTTIEAADKDFRLTILADCCADSDEEVHQVLMNKIFPRRADIVSVAEWCNM